MGLCVGGIDNEREGAEDCEQQAYAEQENRFSAEMLEEMIHELDRLIIKYSSSEWNTKPVANHLALSF